MKLNPKTKFAYGMIGVPDHGYYNLYVTFFMFFVTTVAGMDPKVAGLLTAIGSAWAAFMSVVVGKFSDSLHTKWGRRKPMIIGFAVPMFLIAVTSFHVVSFEGAGKTVYYLIMILLYLSVYNCFFVPYFTWGSEITDDYNERTKLRGIAYTGNMVGLGLATLTPSLIVEHMEKSGISTANAWNYTVIILSSIFIVLQIVGPLMIKEKSSLEESTRDVIGLSADSYETDDKGAESASERRSFGTLVREYIDCVKMKSLWTATLSGIAFLAANACFCSGRVYYFTYNLGYSGIKVTLLFSLVIVTALICIPIINWSTKFLDKRTQFMIGMGTSITGLTALHFMPESFIQGALIMVFFGFADISYWQLGPTMIYDVCEVDQLVHSESRNGTIVSLQALAEAVGESFGLLFLGIYLSAIGFEETSAVQSAKTIAGLEWNVTLIPAIFLVVGFVAIMIYPINHKRYEEVKAALAARERGEEVDIDSFRDLI